MSASPWDDPSILMLEQAFTNNSHGFPSMPVFERWNPPPPHHQRETGKPGSGIHGTWPAVLSNLRALVADQVLRRHRLAQAMACSRKPNPHPEKRMSFSGGTPQTPQIGSVPLGFPFWHRKKGIPLNKRRPQNILCGLEQMISEFAQIYLYVYV